MMTAQDPGPARTDSERVRRRTTAIALAFGLVLCVVGVWGAVRSLSAAGEQAVEQLAATATPSITSSARGSADENGQGPAPDSRRFRSPSGNIGCALSASGVRCDIRDRSWDAGDAPPDCDDDWGAGVQVNENGASVVCGDDSVLEAEQALDYGETAAAGDYLCSSSETGMRCENTSTGSGFVLARRAYELF